MMTAVAGHRNKEVMIIMVARMMRTMAQISRMCLGSRTSTGDWLIASMLALEWTGKESQFCVPSPCLPPGKISKGSDMLGPLVVITASFAGASYYQVCAKPFFKYLILLHMCVHTHSHVLCSCM